MESRRFLTKRGHAATPRGTTCCCDEGREIDGVNHRLRNVFYLLLRSRPPSRTQPIHWAWRSRFTRAHRPATNLT